MKKTRFLFLLALMLLVASLLFSGACSYVTGEAISESIPTQVQNISIKDISATEAYAIIALNAGRYNFTIIDVRTAQEYAAGHIPGAINRDFNSPTFKDDINKLDKSYIYVIYCQTGVRGAGARDVMKELGFQHVSNITGGITAWIAQSLPMVK